MRGERTINEAEAGIVRRVFREFAAGVSPRAIARRLNEEGIPGPSGKLWIDYHPSRPREARHGIASTTSSTSAA